MENFSSKLKQSSVNSDSGMTIVELLVALTISAVISGLCITSTIANKDLYLYDSVRTRINQNLRSGFDVLTAEIRQAGERLPSGFPAIELVDGTNDSLIFRRSLIQEVLTVCQDIAINSTTNAYISSTSGTASPACIYGNQTANYTAFNTYRTSNGNNVEAYIYDFNTKTGEFFEFNAMGDSGSTQYLTRTSGSWANAYNAETTAIYILREWNFQMSSVAGESDILRIIENGDTTAPLKVSFGVNSFNAVIELKDGTTKTAFTKNDSWGQISSIEVSIGGQDTFKGRSIQTVLKSNFFPRNVLSN